MRTIDLGNQIFEENVNGEWTITYKGINLGKVLEEDVIEVVKEKCPENIRKFFPMYGFHE